jgi:hypothetical protein
LTTRNSQVRRRAPLGGGIGLADLVQDLAIEAGAVVVGDDQRVVMAMRGDRDAWGDTSMALSTMLPTT